MCRRSPALGSVWRPDSTVTTVMGSGLAFCLGPWSLVLGTANLITFHGDSVALFEAALHAAVAGYVDACRRLGDAPEKFAMAA